jgi:hypothetical protein
MGDLGMTRKPFIAIGLALALLVAAGVAGILWWQAVDRSEPDGALMTQAEGSDAFAFIGLNAQTRIGRSVRRHLRDELGSEAVARKALIDLRFGPEGTLDTHFPDLARLHRRLNSPLGERREHDALQLRYNYPRRRNLPFDSVQLLFDSVEGRPLLFVIQFGTPGEPLLGTLTERYGSPHGQSPVGEGGWVRWWRQNGAVLTAVLLPDRKGKARYTVRYVFTEHLLQLARREAQAAERRQQDAREKGRRLF